MYIGFVLLGERSAGGNQRRQYSWNDPQSGGRTDPQRGTPHPSGPKERKRLRARLWYSKGTSFILFEFRLDLFDLSWVTFLNT